MSDATSTIEVAKTGRARCRVCREPIAKGDLRFGEQVEGGFGDGPAWAWHHLACGAKKRPALLADALARYEGEVPERAALDAAIAEAAAKAPPPFPYAERAPTARSKCQACGEPIEKGTLRIAVERSLENAGGMARTGAGYLHPHCALDFVNDEKLLGEVKAHSKGLTDEEIAEIAAALAPA